MAWYQNLKNAPDLLLVGKRAASPSSQGTHPADKTCSHPAQRARDKPAAGCPAKEGGEGQGRCPQGGCKHIWAVYELLSSDHQAGLLQ